MPGAVLAIDHGTKRTGFALADALRVTVEPLDVYHGSGEGDELLSHVSSLCAERTVETFVVGHPVNMDGSAGPRARDVDAFCARLAERFPGVRIVKIDERMTTKEAEARLVEAGHTGDARKARRDSWSALVMLEEWLGTEE